MIIGIKLKNNDITLYDGLENFSVELKQDTKEIKIYHNSNFVGILSSLIGIDEDNFVEKMKEKLLC